jgi:hypothetical protein
MVAFLLPAGTTVIQSRGVPTMEGHASPTPVHAQRVAYDS